MKNQQGFTLIELVITIIIFSLTAYALASMMLDRSKYAESVTISKGASDAAENALKAFSAASFEDVPLGGSFAPGDDGAITPGSCTAQTCDYVLEADAPDGGTSSGAAAQESSPAGGTVWQPNYTPPAGTRVAYLRRWRTEDFNAALHLRRLTVAVLTDEAAVKPLVLINTIVADK